MKNYDESQVVKINTVQDFINNWVFECYMNRLKERGTLIERLDEDTSETVKIKVYIQNILHEPCTPFNPQFVEYECTWELIDGFFENYREKGKEFVYVTCSNIFTKRLEYYWESLVDNRFSVKIKDNLIEYECFVKITIKELIDELTTIYKHSKNKYIYIKNNVLYYKNYDGEYVISSLTPSSLKVNENGTTFNYWVIDSLIHKLKNQK